MIVSDGTNENHQLQKSYVPKGRILRNRCAQLKVLERYLNRHHSLFLRGKTTLPPPSKRRLVVPSFESFSDFQSSLSFLPLNSSDETLLILQTVIRSALSAGDQNFQRKCNSLLYDTPSASRIIFLNEISNDTCSSQLEDEVQHSYEMRLFIDACAHMQRTFECEITVLTSDEHDPIHRICQQSGLCVETLRSYLLNMGESSGTAPSVISNVLLLTEEALAHHRCSIGNEPSLSAGASVVTDKPSSSAMIKKSIYPRHISATETEIGLRSGYLQSGKMYIFPHNHLEAEVAVAGGLTVLISGRIDMNRALDGDDVIIRLHPREKWRRIQGSLALTAQADPLNNLEDESDSGAGESQVDGALAADDVSDRGLLVTGTVVSIKRRDISEIVVTIPMMSADKAAAQKENSLSMVSDVLEKENFVLVAPLDMRLPKIRLRTRQWSRLEGHRIIVAFDNWPIDSMFPNGHLVRVIGEANDWRTEVESILIRHSIFPKPFSPMALACVPVIENDISDSMNNNKVRTEGSGWKDSNWKMPTDELSSIDNSLENCRRVDCRTARRVFSVDPPGCQDIDDAMSVHWVHGLEGVIEVAVSIADVCSFLPQGSALDLEAQDRGTTVYLTHKRMDMLPSLISGDIASLHGDKERFAVTVTWHVRLSHSDGRPVNRSSDPLVLSEKGDIFFSTPVLHSCGRTAIISVAAMTYAQAHNLIQGRQPDPTPSNAPPGQAGQTVARHLWEDLRNDLKVLTVFGRFLKAQRDRNGALDLTQTGGELKFKLSGEGEPMDVKCKEEMEVHNTIAELMIIANSTVARIIECYKPSETLVRIHSPPAQAQQKEILKLVTQTGQGIFNGGAPDELRNQLRMFRVKMLFPKGSNGKKEDIKTAESIMDFVTSAVIKSMCEALYVCSGSLSGNIFSSKEANASSDESRLAGHYGLGLAHYTHFTSPIRRYADIIVHRQLLAVLEAMGRGCGLKRVQLPSSSGADGNICLDYSDRSAVIKHTVTSSQDTLDHILPSASSTSLLEDNEVRTLAKSIVPESSVPGLKDLVTTMKFDQRAPTYSLLTPSQSAALDETYPSSTVKLSVAPTTPEDDFLNDLLSGTFESDTVTVKMGDNGDHWDDSFLNNLLDGHGNDNRSEDSLSLSVHQALTMSRMDTSLDFLLDAADAPFENLSIAALADHEESASVLSNSQCNELSGIKGPRSHLIRLKNPGDSPYTGDEVERIAAHLNIMNRRSKAVQMECQKMFLRMYFGTRVEEHDAIVYSLRDNGFLAYVPVFDFKGPVYLQNRAGTVVLDPHILSLKGKGSTASKENNESVNRYDLRGRELPGYECVLTGDEENNAQELLVISNHQSVDTGVNADTNTGTAAALRIVPLQRVRVAMTSAPCIGQSRGSVLRLVLVSVHNEERLAVKNDLKRQEDLMNRFTDIVIESEEKNRLNVEPLRFAPIVKSGEEKCQSLYCSLRDVLTDRHNLINRVNKHRHAALKILTCSNADAPSSSSLLRQAVSSRRYEVLPGRIAFGIHEEMKAIFIRSKNKMSETEKSNERRRADLTDRIEGDDLFLQTLSKVNKKNHSNSYSGTGKDEETELLLKSLKNGKAAAMAKMSLWGEEWPEEVDLPTSWEAGEGGGADTEVGAKASAGGFSKEVYLATARQSKLKVAKKNSKYS